MNNWSLYVHIVPKEITGLEHDKYYVGITGRDPKKRWLSNGHGYQGKAKNIFWNDIKKYGWKNIIHKVILSNMTEEHALEMEKLYIQIFRSNNSEYGYNFNRGGFGGNVKPLVPVVQYDTNGNYIRTWESSAEACRSLNVDRSVITHAIKSKQRVKGFQWRYLTDEPPGVFKKKTGTSLGNYGPRPHLQGGNSHHAKKVVLLNTGEVFECIEYAVKVGGNRSNIAKSCRLKKGSSGRDKNRVRLVWRFYSDYIKMSQEEIAQAIEKAQHPYS